ncbi:MAG TPA: crosslink repair DNA glycosylase YcaQ family protein [Herpetosiphonaceae bacterium]
MSTTNLTLTEAQRIAVAAQALDRRPDTATKADVLDVIRRLGCLQIDTIHVVARSPYFVLWSRLGEYDPAWLDELLYPDRQVFEYWAHAASIIPIEHWPLFRSRMLEYANGESGGWAKWRAENAEVMEHVLAQIGERGPLGAADFEAPSGHKGGGWWDWKPAKIALDALWTSGELMIERRVNFHRRYDLRERLLPGWDDSQLPTEEERRRRLAEIALQAMGLATTRQLADYFRQKQAGLAQVLESLVGEGLAERVQVADWSAPVYVHRGSWQQFTSGLPTPEHTTLLTPFDSLIWHRDRTRDLWGFEYVLECYVPEPKRRYGYFVLAILRRGDLVGRLDAKAERKAGVFRVKAIYLEPHVTLDDAVVADLAQMLLSCARWHRTPEVVIDRSEPAQLQAVLQAAVRA